ncbi:ankyrin repeat protein SKIP35-like [Pyrus ussuriensis x Pyrus communis]|uniref:Ankyrin repeat protein SKIP35-like n=1 Tax=Pyrus ussuriensis x Pyrus communis TaxID=2448454 RepID=A0A5N5F1N9_9ROSA|nr:ankyrin repeat protein SKIP35-like [Pyrus ussuriensis x Pyrus communis]
MCTIGDNLLNQTHDCIDFFLMLCTIGNQTDVAAYLLHQLPDDLLAQLSFNILLTHARSGDDDDDDDDDDANLELRALLQENLCEFLYSSTDKFMVCTKMGNVMLEKIVQELIEEWCSIFLIIAYNDLGRACHGRGWHGPQQRRSVSRHIIGHKDGHDNFIWPCGMALVIANMSN